MKKFYHFLYPFVFLMSLCISPHCAAEFHAPLITADIQQRMTPDDALDRLIQGNARFASDSGEKINYLKNRRLTEKAQHPIAIVLSCIDSRVPPDVIFNQNVGNIFVTRVAANVINPDILAGLEYATGVSGAKLIVVMGHENCGAVKGACQDVKLGHLTQLLDKIQPAIQEATATFGKKECDNEKFINLAAEDNVRHVVAMIPTESPEIKKLMQSGKIKIVGAMYHLKTGRVVFLKT